MGSISNSKVMLGLDSLPISESGSDLQSIIQNYGRIISRNIESCMPGIVNAYNRDTGLASVTSMVRQMNTSGEALDNEPMVVTVMRRQFGGFLIDAPLVEGDTGWIIGADMDTTFAKKFNSRVMGGGLKIGQTDGEGKVIANQGQQNPASTLRHKLSFGFFIPDKWGAVLLPDEFQDSLVIQTITPKQEAFGRFIMNPDGSISLLSTRHKVDDNMEGGRIFVNLVYNKDDPTKKNGPWTEGDFEVLAKTSLRGNTFVTTWKDDDGVVHDGNIYIEKDAEIGGELLVGGDETIEGALDVKGESVMRKPLTVVQSGKAAVIDPETDLRKSDAKFREMNVMTGIKDVQDNKIVFETRKVRVLADEGEEGDKTEAEIEVKDGGGGGGGGIEDVRGDEKSVQHYYTDGANTAYLQIKGFGKFTTQKGNTSGEFQESEAKSDVDEDGFSESVMLARRKEKKDDYKLVYQKTIPSYPAPFQIVKRNGVYVVTNCVFVWHDFNDYKQGIIETLNDWNIPIGSTEVWLTASYSYEEQKWEYALNNQKKEDGDRYINTKLYDLNNDGSVKTDYRTTFLNLNDSTVPEEFRVGLTEEPYITLTAGKNKNPKLAMKKENADIESVLIKTEDVKEGKQISVKSFKYTNKAGIEKEEQILSTDDIEIPKGGEGVDLPPSPFQFEVITEEGEEGEEVKTCQIKNNWMFFDGELIYATPDPYTIGEEDSEVWLVGVCTPDQSNPNPSPEDWNWQVKPNKGQSEEGQKIINIKLYDIDCANHAVSCDYRTTFLTLTDHTQKGKLTIGLPDKEQLVEIDGATEDAASITIKDKSGNDKIALQDGSTPTITISDAQGTQLGLSGGDSPSITMTNGGKTLTISSEENDGETMKVVKVTTKKEEEEEEEEIGKVLGTDDIKIDIPKSTSYTAGKGIKIEDEEISNTGVLKLIASSGISIKPEEGTGELTISCTKGEISLTGNASGSEKITGDITVTAEDDANTVFEFLTTTAKQLQLKFKGAWGSRDITLEGSEVPVSKFVGTEDFEIAQKKIKAGTGIEVSESGNEVTISATGGATPSTVFSGTKTVIIDVDYDSSGKYLRKKTATLVYENGFLTSWTDNDWANYHQAVQETV